MIEFDEATDAAGLVGIWSDAARGALEVHQFVLDGKLYHQAIVPAQAEDPQALEALGWVWDHEGNSVHYQHVGRLSTQECITKANEIRQELSS